MVPRALIAPQHTARSPRPSAAIIANEWLGNRIETKIDTETLQSIETATSPTTKTKIVANHHEFRAQFLVQHSPRKLLRALRSKLGGKSPYHHIEVRAVTAYQFPFASDRREQRRGDPSQRHGRMRFEGHQFRRELPLLGQPGDRVDHRLVTTMNSIEVSDDDQGLCSLAHGRQVLGVGWASQYTGSVGAPISITTDCDSSLARVPHKPPSWLSISVPAQIPASLGTVQACPLG